MAMLKPHVADMEGTVHTALATLFRALHQPSSLNHAPEPISLPMGVEALADSVADLVNAVNKLNRRVFNANFCSESERWAAAHGFEKSVRGIIGVYADALFLLGTEPGRRAAALERAVRANMERLVMWLADILSALVDPERLYWESDYDDGRFEKEYSLHFSFPDTEEELDDRVEQPTGYDAGLVRDALAAARASDRTGTVCLPDDRHAARPRSADSGLGFWGTLGTVILGIALFDGLFGDDCDPDA